MGEARETQHHLDVAKEKGCLAQRRFEELDESYNRCGRMLERLHQALSHWRGSTRTGRTVREPETTYESLSATRDWRTVEQIAEQVMGDFA